MSTVAVVGATGAVGMELLEVLHERKFPVDELRLLASSRSAGTVITAAGQDHEVRLATPDAFDGVDLALFSAGSGTARELAPAARKRGALVVDNSSAFRLEPDCPLVVPELNGDAIDGHAGIIANPNCSAILLTMAIAPLHASAGLKQLVVCTYQAVSGAGARAMDEWERQEQADAAGETPAAELFPAVIARNVIPWVQAIEADGYSTEETKLLLETRRILDLPDLALSATCVRVPVRRAHAQAIHASFERPIAPAAARTAFGGRPGVRVEENTLPTPRDVAGTDDVVVGRIREDRVFRPGLALWAVMDQLRKGAALNAVQIAERAMRIRAR
ncbi:MAG: aspartate-semialdehyde dehydrogenase [Planctomycetota bacterium]|nr:aspartate-semialdehyde dehydrogenase [Planctomycetota bacterium]